MEAVYSDRSFPVNNSVVTLHVPAPAKIDNMDTYYTPADMKLLDDQTAQFTATQRIPAGQAMEVRAQFTHGVVAGAPAPWQAAEDQRAAQLEQQSAYDTKWRPMANVAAGALSLLMLVLAPLGLYLIWYTRGRDAQTDFVAEYLPEPPSNLSAGMAGTLLDEQADMEDILASLIDLGRRGYVKMEELEPKKLDLFGRGESDFKYTLLKQPDESLRGYERQLLTALFGVHEERNLSDLKAKFYKSLPAIKKALYEEVTSEDFFVSNPESTRSRWSALGVVALVVALLLGCGITSLLSAYTDLAIFLPAGFGVFAFGLIFLARFMPREDRQRRGSGGALESFPHLPHQDREVYQPRTRHRVVRTLSTLRHRFRSRA